MFVRNCAVYSTIRQWRIGIEGTMAVRETKRAGDVIEDWRHNQKAFVINLAGSKYQMPGIPDCVVIKNDNLHIWVEFKKDDKRLSPKQVNIANQMAAQGAHVYLVQFFDEKLWIIDDLYHINFRFLKDAYRRLLDTLVELETSRLKNLPKLQCEFPSTMLIR